MSDPLKNKQTLRPDDPVPHIPFFQFLANLLTGSGKPTPPPGPLPEEQLGLLGRHFQGQIRNNPEEMSYYVEQTTEPYGKLGRMLSDEERLALLKMLMR